MDIKLWNYGMHIRIKSILYFIISYDYYTIDYKYAGITVEVQETNLGKELLVYLNGILLTTLKLK